MIFSFLLSKMQGPQKGDALSPRPTNCILRTRSNEENAANADWWSLPGGAQDPMSLREAVHLALDKNKSVEACILILADTFPIRRAELLDRAVESTRFPQQPPIPGHG